MTASLRAKPPAWLAAILPGLHGRPGDVPAVAELPGDLLAATTTTPAAPVPTGLAPQLFAGAGPGGFRRTLSDLIPTVPMSGGALQVPSLAVGPAIGGPHAEGASKTEAALTFAGRTNPAASIATWVSLTDELLDDVAGLDGWLRLFLPYLVKLSEERELLLSNGTTPSKIVGFFTPGLVPDYVPGTPPASTVADIVAAMIGQAAKSGFAPDTVVMSAADWGALVVSHGSIGSGALDVSAGTFGGLAIVASHALVAGQILVGPLQSLAALGREGGILVEGTRSHALFFTANKAAVRAQSRLALAVLMTSAFVKKS